MYADKSSMIINNNHSAMANGFQGGYRQGIVDIWRMVAILLIMAHHTYGFDQTPYPFQLAWIYVEFFFIVSGYYTAKHFCETGNHIKNDKQIVCINALRYTLKKYAKIFPYSFLAILMQYIILAVRGGYQGKIALLGDFQGFLYEVFMLSSTGLTAAKLGPVWYLSAMFIVLPFICILLQKASSFYLYILSWTVPAIYYGWAGVSGLRSWPHDMLRAFACISLGIFVYALSCRLGKKKIFVSHRILLTVIELGCLSAVVYMTYRNITYNNMILMLFVIGCILMFSGKTFTVKVKGRICSWLGKISMVLFLFHWPVMELITSFDSFDQFSIGTKILVYYCGSILLSVVIFLFMKKISKSEFIRNKKLLGKE